MTTSMLRNAAKSNWKLDELGWQLVGARRSIDVGWAVEMVRQLCRRPSAASVRPLRQQMVQRDTTRYQPACVVEAEAVQRRAGHTPAQAVALHARTQPTLSTSWQSFRSSWAWIGPRSSPPSRLGSGGCASRGVTWVARIPSSQDPTPRWANGRSAIVIREAIGPPFSGSSHPGSDRARPGVLGPGRRRSSTRRRLCALPALLTSTNHPRECWSSILVSTRCTQLSH